MGWGEGFRDKSSAVFQLSLLSSEALASDILSSPAEQPRTGEIHLLKRTSDLILFILYQISTSHSLGTTGGDTVNCYSLHFLFFPLTEHKHIITQLHSTIFRVDFELSIKSNREARLLYLEPVGLAGEIDQSTGEGRTRVKPALPTIMDPQGASTLCLFGDKGRQSNWGRASILPPDHPENLLFTSDRGFSFTSLYRWKGFHRDIEHIFQEVHSLKTWLKVAQDARDVACSTKIQVFIVNQLWKVILTMFPSLMLAVYSGIRDGEELCIRETFLKLLIPRLPHFVLLRNLLLLIMPVNTYRTNNVRTHFRRHYYNSDQYGSLQHYLWPLSQHCMSRARNVFSILRSEKTRNGEVEWHPDQQR